jgi:hypothetical protein
MLARMQHQQQSPGLVPMRRPMVVPAQQVKVVSVKVGKKK